MNTNPVAARFRLPAARALALAVLLGGGVLSVGLSGPFAPRAVGAELQVDMAYGNSPYSLTTNAAYVNVYVGTLSTGVLNHSAGNLTLDYNLILGYYAGTGGTYNLSGTGSVSTLDTFIGQSGTGVFNQSGGSFTTRGATLYLGYSTGGNGS